MVGGRETTVVTASSTVLTVDDSTAISAIATDDVLPACVESYLPEVPGYAYMGCIDKPPYNRDDPDHKTGAFHNLAAVTDVSPSITPSITLSITPSVSLYQALSLHPPSSCSSLLTSSPKPLPHPHLTSQELPYRPDPFVTGPETGDVCDPSKFVCNNPSTCAAQCAQKGFAFAGIAWGAKWCYCGDDMQGSCWMGACFTNKNW